MAQEIPDGLVAIARIVGAWGLRGELKAEALAPPEVLTSGRQVTVADHVTTIERASEAGRHLRLKLSGVESREEATGLRGLHVLTPADSLPALPAGVYYRFQLLGLRVAGAGGEDLGVIEDVFSTAANDVYVVRGPLGEILIPAVDDVVMGIDLAGRLVTIEVIPGLLP